MSFASQLEEEVQVDVSSETWVWYSMLIHREGNLYSLIVKYTGNYSRIIKFLIKSMQSGVFGRFCILIRGPGVFYEDFELPSQTTNMCSKGHTSCIYYQQQLTYDDYLLMCMSGVTGNVEASCWSSQIFLNSFHYSWSWKRFFDGVQNVIFFLLSGSQWCNTGYSSFRNKIIKTTALGPCFLVSQRV